MDASRFKRREIQTRSETNTVNPRSKSIIVAEVLLSRARNHQVGPAQVESLARRLPAVDQGSVNRLRFHKVADEVSVPVAQPKPKVQQLRPVHMLSAVEARRPSRVKPYESDQTIAKQFNQSPETYEGGSGLETLRSAIGSSVVAAALSRTTWIDMSLPGLDSPVRRLDGLLRSPRIKLARKWAFRGTAIVLAILIGAGSFIMSQGLWRAHKVFHGGAAPVAALQKNVDPNLLKGEGDGRINVLLLGRGGTDHTAPDLTDTMILASIDPVNHTEALVSIPRDLWVQVPNAGQMKINAAWETGEFKYLHKVAPGSTDSNAVAAGFSLVDQVVKNVTGVDINYNILINFPAFRQAVDTVGGITVNVPTDLVDPTMAWENNGNPVLATAGTDTFDGKTALNYVRSRETTTDFARAQRQRAVLLALKQKVDTLGTLSNPLKLSSLMSTFGNNVQTDLSMSDAYRLYGIIKGIGDDQTTSIGLADPPNKFVGTGAMGNQSIDLPTAGLYNYGPIQDYLRTQLIDGYILKEQAPVLVLNGTDQPGLATTIENQLKSYGYNVTGVGDAPTNGYAKTQVLDLSHGQDKYTAHYLGLRFNTTPTSNLPDTRLQPNGAAFVIIVGSDETTSQ